MYKFFLIHPDSDRSSKHLRFGCYWSLVREHGVHHVAPRHEDGPVRGEHAVVQPEEDVRELAPVRRTQEHRLQRYAKVLKVVVIVTLFRFSLNVLYNRVTMMVRH